MINLLLILKLHNIHHKLLCRVLSLMQHTAVAFSTQYTQTCAARNEGCTMYKWRNKKVGAGQTDNKNYSGETTALDWAYSEACWILSKDE